jgi:hypothetical protein
MSGRWERLDTQKIVTGLGLATVGVIMLLNRIDYWPHIWKLWPLWLGLVGIGKLIAHPSRAEYGDGLLMLAMCVFFLGVTYHWYGLTYRNSWPLIIVFVGLSLVVNSFTGKRSGAFVKIRAGHKSEGEAVVGIRPYRNTGGEEDRS